MSDSAVSGGGFDGDVMAERFESSLEPGGLVGGAVAFVPPVDAQVGVVALVGVHVPERDDDRVGGGDDRFLLADPPCEPPEPRRQPRVA